MLKFFDYVFYRVCKAYKKTTGSSPEFTALFILTLMQFSNLAVVIGIYFQIFHIYSISKINSLIVIFVIAIMIILNFFRYNKLNYNILKERWKDEDAETQQRKGSRVMLYIIFSVIAVIGVIIWRANTK